MPVLLCFCLIRYVLLCPSSWRTIDTYAGLDRLHYMYASVVPKLSEPFTMAAARAQSRYERKKQDAESAKYGARWQALFMFQQMHEADRPAGARPVRLVGSDNAVYERLYRAEPRKVRYCCLARHS
jgi:hypothetical protein